jgi:HAE1 family hydrophobic/amphiphilic exporter-1/multidrug efflux pump
VFARFFIDRPVFASVLSILIVIAGGVSILALPIANLPEVTPPNVQVEASYPGANAETVEASVATPIEQEVNGTPGMLYLSSRSANDGSMRLTVTFALGTDIDLAAVDVQNRVSRAEPRLPRDVVLQGITVRQASTDLLLVASFSSRDPRYDSLFLSNYLTINMLDAVRRAPGVGNAVVFGGGDYAMRIWLNPDRLANLQLTAKDVATAIGQQNVQAAAGQIGAPPAPRGQELQYSVQARGRLVEPAEFENVILRTRPDGSAVRVKDVARVELGAQTYAQFSRFNGRPAASIGVFQQPGANALETANNVKAVLRDLGGSLPPGVEYTMAFDTTPFVVASIEEVVKTLFEAIALVLLVVYLFLQSWRATLIPLAVVPVSVVGTFAGMLAFGFSINTLTLFGLVLAIGLVVDDAIVVVEAVAEKIEGGLAPREATRAAMAEVAAPVVAIALVLSAVFVPVIFLGGPTGQLYRQFAVTIALSVLISALNALTLSPALCALLLRPRTARRGILSRFFDAFNRIFDRATSGYLAGVRFVIRRAGLGFAVVAVLFVATWGLFQRLPTAFVPTEDQGTIFVNVALPDGASLQRTAEVMTSVETILTDTPGVENVMAIGGQSLVTGTVASSAGTVLGRLRDWSERTTPELHVNGILAGLQPRLAAVPGAVVTAFVPPPIPGLGVTGGFEYQLESRAGGDVDTLARTARAVIAEGNAGRDVNGLFTGFRAAVPRIELEVDRLKALNLGVPIATLFTNLQAYLGSLYVNDFNLFGRTYRVQIQAEPAYRATPDDIGRIQVRGGAGGMIPLNAVTTARLGLGPDTITHFNLFRSIQINGAPAPGRSSGDAIAAMQALSARALPAGFSYEWSGLSYQEIEAGGQMVWVLALGLVFVLLLLAAQYESWTLPLAVALGIPFAILGALVAQLLRGHYNDVYTQIALLMLIGLAAKNAILIVEFSVLRREAGLGIMDAAVDASRRRFRPILMTSFAFILGVVPLVIASGAGSASRRSLGTAVFGGMLAATTLTILFVPLFYVTIQRLGEGRRARVAHRRETPRGAVSAPDREEEVA